VNQIGAGLTARRGRTRAVRPRSSADPPDL